MSTTITYYIIILFTYRNDHLFARFATFPRFLTMNDRRFKSPLVYYIVMVSNPNNHYL